jgi:hypothetical protein
MSTVLASQHSGSVGPRCKIVSLDDPSYSDLRVSIPWREVVKKLRGMDADGRVAYWEKPRSFQNALVRRYDPADMLHSYIKDVLCTLDGPLRNLELNAVKDIGPQVSTSWDRYSDERFYAHYVEYTRTKTDEEVLELFNAVDRILQAYIAPCEPRTPQEVWYRRKRTSSLGPSFMKSLDDMENQEYYATMYETVAYCERLLSYARQGLVELPFDRLLCVPGTRVSHAPIDSPGEDQNRAILMIDFPGYMCLGMFMYPVYDMMKVMPFFRNIWFRQDVVRAVRSRRSGFTFIGADSSRMDQRLQYDPYGKYFARFMKRFYEPCYHPVIDSLVFHHHHPLVFTPEGIVDGEMGNASGAVSTTAENSYLTLALEIGFLLDQGLTEGRISDMLGNGDLELLSHGDDAGIIIRDGYLTGDISVKLAETWSSYGFKAKPEKQYVSGDTLLFLKRYWSNDNRIGTATMLLTNIVKKLIWQQPGGGAEDYLSFQVDLEDLGVDTSMLNMIRKSNIRANRWWDRPGPRILPGRDAEWPYFQNNPEVSRYLLSEGWSGLYGPISIHDIEHVTETLSSYGVTTDRYDLSWMAMYQSIAECWTHPGLDTFITWFMNYSREALNMSFLFRKEVDSEPQETTVSDRSDRLMKGWAKDAERIAFVRKKIISFYRKNFNSDPTEDAIVNFIHDRNDLTEIKLLTRLSDALEYHLLNDYSAAARVVELNAQNAGSHSEFGRMWIRVVRDIVTGQMTFDVIALQQTIRGSIELLSAGDLDRAVENILELVSLAADQVRPSTSNARTQLLLPHSTGSQ